MNFTIEKEEKHALVTSKVEKLDSQTAPDLKSELVLLAKTGFRNIAVDLSSTRYCDSSGLSALLTGNRICKESDGVFVLAGVQPAVQKLISISQLTSVLNIVPTANEAVDWIMMEEIDRELGEEGRESEK